MEIIIFTVIWLILGAGSFIFWWTKDFDFVSQDLIVAMFFAMLGPIAFIAGYFIHRGINKESKIIIKKRK